MALPIHGRDGTQEAHDTWAEAPPVQVEEIIEEDVNMEDVKPKHVTGEFNSAEKGSSVLAEEPAPMDIEPEVSPMLLGQAPASSAQHRVLGPDGQRREALRARDLQPGTLPYRAAHATTQPGTYRTTEPAQDIRNLLPPGLDALEEGAFQFLDWFHGAPFALYSKVGHDAGLPPVHNLGGLYPLRPRRERSLPSALRRRNFSIHGYCLLSCQAHCGWACSRPVSTDARQLHDHHFCQVCHR